MKVNPNRDLQAAMKLSRPAKQATRPPGTPAPSDFQASTKLALKLAATPEVRADKVNRAKALLVDPNYPDAKTVQQVARKLADNIQLPNSDS